jgi:hypothetical protein
LLTDELDDRREEFSEAVESSTNGEGTETPLPIPVPDREWSLDSVSPFNEPALKELPPQSFDGRAIENGDALPGAAAPAASIFEDHALDAPAVEAQSVGRYAFDDDVLGEVLDELATQGTALGFRRSKEDDDDGGVWPLAEQPDSTADSAGAGNVNALAPGQAASASRPHARGSAARAAAKRGISLDRMIAAVRAYVGDELQWDLQLILSKEDTPPLGLGIVGNLGWSSWVIRDNMRYDPSDLVLDAMATPAETQKIEYRHVRAWDHKTLGQRRDGQYIVATIDMGDLSVVQTALSS